MKDVSEKHAEVTKYLAQGKPAFIFFRLEGCTPCEQTIPQWDEMVKLMENGEDDVIVAKIESQLINGVKQKDGSNFNVRSFPSIKFINEDGNVLDYDGDRSKEDLVRWVQKNSSASPKRKSNPTHGSVPHKKRKQQGGTRRRKGKKSRRKSRRRSRTYRMYH